eukprot:3790020-Rhodomonas_salina.1
MQTFYVPASVLPQTSAVLMADAEADAPGRERHQCHDASGLGGALLCHQQPDHAVRVRVPAVGQVRLPVQRAARGGDFAGPRRRDLSAAQRQQVHA